MIENSIKKNKAITEELNLLVRQFRIKLLLHTLINIAPWLVLLIATRFYFNYSIIYSAVAFSGICLIAILLKLRSDRYQQVTLDSLLLHLNRTFPQLQESAHLINRNNASFSILQHLQKDRVTVEVEQLLVKNRNHLLPKISIRDNLISASIALSVLLAININILWQPNITTLESENSNEDTSKLSSIKGIGEISIKQSEVNITPPTYTKLSSELQSELNASGISGSTFGWHLIFNQIVDSAFIEFSSGQRLPLNFQHDNFYAGEIQIDFTGIYRIGVVNEAIEYMLPEIYSLKIIKDSKANIKFITPKKTITEIATNADSIVPVQVRITDDFKVVKVEILASIAKGSGESVKFRDQTFLFGSNEVIDGAEHFYKTWNLVDLKMEPGDELYFTIKAWDNRQPDAQLTRSSTKIIRWLEDEQQGVLSDGILIDFMPEYFKSQRQIIIETIELIEDKEELSTNRFVETSELLGVSQSELKEKYGQYLGDEVEDGGGSHAISHEASEHISALEEAELIDDTDDDHHHENHDESGGHATDGFEMSGFGVDKSGKTDLINRFGHNHEDADIGIMAQQDPKALMKRSIANMWQAELHLMLSEPNKALPFEQEALKFLKMAKKAERIYVKRLGFEPPPVSEQRRYQGDLDDIYTYQNNQTVDLSNSEKNQLSEMYIWLNNEVSKPLYNKPSILSSSQRQLTINVKKQFELLVETRPALIKYVAVLEQILQANTLNLTKCQSCLVELSEKIWQILPESIAKPHSTRRPFLNSDALFNKYAEFLSGQL